MKGKIANNKEDNLSEEELQGKSLELYEQNWKVSEICSSLHCSKSWFY